MSPFTQEHKNKISKALKGKPRPYASHKRPEHSKFLKKWWANHPEEREKARQRGLRLVQSKEYLEKLSVLLSGENNPNWRNGESQKKYRGFYQKLKNKIRKRDGFKCQLCGKLEQELGYTLSIHHTDFNKENNAEDNLVAVCKHCNSIINFGREKWINFFKEKIAATNGSGLETTKLEHAPSAD